MIEGLSGSLIYTPDGKVPSSSRDRTMFMVSRSMGNFRVVDKRQSAITRLKQLPLEDVNYDERDVREVEIDGISGYEIVAKALDKASASREPVMVHQVMLFAEGGYYLLIGKARTDYDTNLALFRKIANTFKQK